MKTKLSLWIITFLSAGGVFGQGTINFANLVVVDGVRIVDAPVRNFDGTLLSGGGFTAELLAGTSAGSLSPVGLPTPFLTGAEAGYFSGGIRTIDSVLPGGLAFVQIRAWQLSTGPTYDFAFNRGLIEMTVQTGGIGGGPPGNLIGMQPFCIGGFGCVPEPSTLALLFLGGVFLTAHLQRR